MEIEPWVWIFLAVLGWALAFGEWLANNVLTRALDEAQRELRVWMRNAFESETDLLRLRDELEATRAELTAARTISFATQKDDAYAE